MEKIEKALEEIINNEKDNLSKEDLVDRILEKQKEVYEKLDKDELFRIYKTLIL